MLKDITQIKNITNAVTASYGDNLASSVVSDAIAGQSVTSDTSSADNMLSQNQESVKGDFSLTTENSTNNLEKRIKKKYNKNISYSLYTDDVMFSSGYNEIAQVQSTRKLYDSAKTGQDQSEKMITTNGTWNKLLNLGLDKVKDFAEKEGVKREISKLGLTEREAQEIIRQFRGKKTDTRRGVEITARSTRGGRKIRTIYETEKKNESPEKRNEVNFSDEEDASYSLKWHTDLTRAQLKTVEGWIRKAGNPESTRITDTANWHKGRLNGETVFVIYSDKPTILYERRGTEGKAELDILMDILEDEENGESINGKPSFTQGVSQGSWLQNVNNSQNNLTNLGTRTNNQNVGVLQGQPRRNGSGAFWNVIENLFRIQEKVDAAKQDSEGKTLTKAQQEINRRNTDFKKRPRS